MCNSLDDKKFDLAYFSEKTKAGQNVFINIDGSFHEAILESIVKVGVGASFDLETKATGASVKVKCTGDILSVDKIYLLQK